MCEPIFNEYNFEGWYVIFDELSPQLLHKSYCALNNAEEFLTNIEKGVYDFGDEVETICSLASVTTISRRKLIKCSRLTQLMQIAIFSCRIIEKKKMLFFPDRLFVTEDEADRFIDIYKREYFTGFQMQLAKRTTFNLQQYVSLKIEMDLQTAVPKHGENFLRISFAKFQNNYVECLQYLHTMRCAYTNPQIPGFFKHVEVDITNLAIVFYFQRNQTFI
jgi:hypothetical protein